MNETKKESNDQNDKNDRNDRNDKNDRNDRNDRNNRNYKNDRIDRNDKNENVIDYVDKKIDLIVLNNGWNDKNETLIVSIGENAASYKWMHEKCNTKYVFYNKFLNIIIIIFNTVLTTQTFITTESDLVSLSKKIFIYIVTLLSVINNFLKFEELSINHLNAIKQFSELYHNIQQQMCMYRKDRLIASIYIKEVIKQYDSLIVTCPDISPNILNEFKKKFQNTDISIPDIADKIQKIDIITNPTNNFDLEMQNVDPINTNSYNINYLPKDTFIQQSLKINGDITEEDIPSISILLKKKAINATSEYEYNRLFREV
jgi:hypothetical protein